MSLRFLELRQTYNLFACQEKLKLLSRSPELPYGSLWYHKAITKEQYNQLRAHNCKGKHGKHITLKIIQGGAWGYYFPDTSTLLSSFDPDPISPAIASAVASFICSLSPAVLCSLDLGSFSSSLSPRLNGSFSETGDGSTVDKGCHLLGLLPADEVCLSGAS